MVLYAYSSLGSFLSSFLVLLTANFANCGTSRHEMVVKSQDWVFKNYTGVEVVSKRALLM